MTHLGEMEEELDEGVVADHLRGHDMNSFRDHGYLQFANFDKTEQNWMNSISHQRNPVEESSPQARSHLSPEPSSELASVSNVIKFLPFFCFHSDPLSLMLSMHKPPLAPQ